MLLYRKQINSSNNQSFVGSRPWKPSNIDVIFYLTLTSILSHSLILKLKVEVEAY